MREDDRLWAALLLLVVNYSFYRFLILFLTLLSSIISLLKHRSFSVLVIVVDVFYAGSHLGRWPRVDNDFLLHRDNFQLIVYFFVCGSIRNVVVPVRHWIRYSSSFLFVLYWLLISFMLFLLHQSFLNWLNSIAPSRSKWRLNFVDMLLQLLGRSLKLLDCRLQAATLKVYVKFTLVFPLSATKNIVFDPWLSVLSSVRRLDSRGILVFGFFVLSNLIEHRFRSD